MQGILLALVDEMLGREYGAGPWGTGRPRTVDGSEADDPPGTADGVHGVDGADAPSDALVCWFGRRAIPLLAERYPSLFRKHGTLRSFLESLSDSERPGAAGDGAPAVAARSGPDGELFLSLGAEGPTCALVKGLVAGAARQYGEAVRIEELKCGAGGDNRCVLRVGFEETARPASGVRPAQRRARLA